jgi:tetratricopeptide (TPR) repeat protein
MKICPFISHMIGTEHADVLQIDGAASGNIEKRTAEKSAASDVVILGYDDDSVGVKTKPAKAKKRAANAPSHLFCIEDTCRFYHKKAGGCIFDSMSESIKNQAKAAVSDEAERADIDKLVKTVNKEFEKFWKFQTKSVAELIASVGENDEKQQKTLGTFKNYLEKSVNDIKSLSERNDADDIKNEFSMLQKAMESRDEGIENFSTTVSEHVLNIDDALNALKEKHETLVERIGELESSIHQMDNFHKQFESSLNRTLESFHAPRISEEVKSMSDKFESVLNAHAQIEERLNSWVENLESRIREVLEQQDSWDERLERISNTQTEVMDLVQQGRKRHEDESSWIRKKEAKKLNNLGVTSFHNGAFEVARDQFLEAVALDGEFAESYNNLGLVYTELKEEEKATDAFSRAIELNPDMPAVYNNLGYVFYKQGSYDQAIEMYNEALGRSTDNSSAHTNLGNAYFKLGNLDEAKRAWEKALEVDPTNEKAARNLKRLENA